MNTANFTALGRKTVELSGTDTAGLAPPQLATSLVQTEQSRAFCDKKRAEHKDHNQALSALVLRCCNVLCAISRDGAYFYAPKVASAA